MSSKWRILLLNTKDSNPNYYIVLSIEQALRRHPAVEAVFNVDYHNVLPTALRERTNLFLAVDGEQLDRGLCRRAAALCGASALWVSEDPYDRALNRRNAELFEQVFTNDSSSVATYDGRAAHLPFAANPRFHELALPDLENEARHYLYDVLFIGTAWPNRVEFLKRLRHRIPSLRWKLALPTNPHLPRVDLGLPPSSYSWRAANIEVARFANRSRIVLGLHRDFALGGNPASSATPGPRLFETALAGGFQLVDASLPEVSDYYEAGREMATFAGLDDCAKKIEHFLAHPAERLAIARAAQQRTRAEHLYDHRAAQLLERVGPHRDRLARPVAIVGDEGRTRARRALFVCHNHISLGGFGGVEVYVDLIARHLPADIEPILYFPDRSVPEARRVRLLDVRRETTRDLRFATPWTAATLTNREREERFARLLHDERIDLVHFHHMLGHPWSLPLVARSQGIPTVMSVQDFFSSCVHFNLVNPQRRYCRAPELPAETCDMCLQEHSERGHGQIGGPGHSIGPGSQTSRRGYVSAVFDALDLLLFISQTAHDHTAALLPARLREGQVAVEGLPIPNDVAPQARTKVRLPLKVGVPGNLTAIKGGDSLCRIFAALREEPIEFHVFGRVDGPYDDILKRMRLPNVYLEGGYRPDEACERLATCDVALLLSMWPETYVLTLSESWRCGVVPIVTDIGALGERVTHNVNGFKVPVDEPAAVVARLRDVLDNPEQLPRIRRNIHPGLYRLLDDHLGFLVGHYRRLMAQYRVDERNDAFYEDYPRARAAGGTRAFHLSTDWPSYNSCSTPNLAPPATLALPAPSLLRQARRYLRTHGVRATVRRAMREFLLRRGIRLP